jgi:hypothetical protein
MMTTTLKIQQQILKTAQALLQMQTSIDKSLQHMLDTNVYYKLFAINGATHPYYNIRSAAVNIHTAVYLIFEAVLDCMINEKSIRMQFDETREKDIVKKGADEDELINEIRTLKGSAKSASVVAQQLISAYEMAAILSNYSHPKVVRSYIIKAKITAGKMPSIHQYEQDLHKACDAVRKEIVRLSKAIRLVQIGDKTIEHELGKRKTMLILKNQNVGAIEVLMIKT